MRRWQGRGLGQADMAQKPDLRHRLEGRPFWITLAATPFLLTAFFQAPPGMASDLGAFGLIACAMWMTREGLRAEAAYDRQPRANRPALPRKLLGALLAGLGLGLGAAEPGALAGAGLIALAGIALHLLAFGADPMRDKGSDRPGDFQQGRAERMIAEGRASLEQMKQEIRRCNDPGLEARVALFAGTVTHLFEQVSRDPGDLGRVRRYLGIYLTAARDATSTFARLHPQTRDQQAHDAYEALLVDLENGFSALSRKLREGDRADLDLEISVLRERLSRDGLNVAAARPAPPRDTEELDELLSFTRDKDA